MSLQKIMPVVASICIIIVIAVLKEKSRTLAIIFSTMPVNMALGLWILSGNANGSEQMADYTKNLIVGLTTAFVWLFVVYFAFRAGWGLLPSIGTGYAVWAVLVGLAVLSGVLKLKT